MTDARARLTLWAPRLVAVLAGMAAAFAHPPWGLLPGLLGYAVMFHLVDRAPGVRAGLLRGWCAGGGYFVVSVWWISEPFQVDAAEQGWMAPFAVVLLSAFLGLFWGAAAGLYRLAAGRGAARVLLFAGTLALAEFLRGHLLTGFPWDLPGETWRAGSALSQGASVVGAYGLTWLTLAIAAAPGLLGDDRRPSRGALAATAVALVALAGLWGWGAQRLADAGAPVARGPLVRIVQANVAQASKYDQALFASIVGRYVTLTGAAAARQPDVVVWPEGAIPAAMDDYLAPETWTRSAVMDALAPGQTLILGGYRFGTDRAGQPVTYNSLAALRRQGDALAMIGLYDKFRLVPFGEFMPLDGLASRLGIKQMVHVGDGFSPGPRPRPMRIPGLPPAQPLICYEALYPGFTREGAQASGLRADWIVNISNDAWFGTASGPAQQLNIARYRAIEEGLPMVRATPTGISAMIDAYGRIAPGASLGEGVRGVLDRRLPDALAPTLFNQWGDVAFWLMMLASLAGARVPAAALVRGPAGALAPSRREKLSA